MAQDPVSYGKVETVVLMPGKTGTPVPPGTMDMVLTFRNLHNWMGQDQARPMLEAMYKSLKSGGYLGIEEHRGLKTVPQDPKAASGYVREDYAAQLIESVGFKLVAKSEVNANPKDTKDYPKGVWTLPPTLRDGDTDKAKYMAIGESDRFTMLFQKPK
jgi:predicted methyltransferase